MPLISKIILGTVQLGLDYGINNTGGKPSLQESFAILQAAYDNGIGLLDTAEAYGNSQEIIGKYNRTHSGHFKIISKLSANAVLESGTGLRDHVLNTLDELGADSLEGYLFHNFPAYKKFAYWNDLLQLKAEGKIINLGVSVYNNSEALEAAMDERITIVQLPYNVLDNFNVRKEALRVLKEKQKQVHIRSVFLQGLVFKDIDTVPPKLKALLPYLEELKRIAGLYDLSIKQLCLAYALFNEEVDGVLIGVDNAEQLSENIKLIKELKINTDLRTVMDAGIFVKETELLNPVNWQ
jgi:aryl-alcohol dehydrogenase-like predicted oxidoreductase